MFTIANIMEIKKIEEIPKFHNLYKKFPEILDSAESKLEEVNDKITNILNIAVPK